MKIALITALLLLSLSANCQTTEIEYNYIKKGLQTSFEQGMDIKKGYFIEDIVTGSAYGNGTVTAKLVRREVDSTIAGTWVKVYVSGTWSGNGTFYFCIPAATIEYDNPSHGWTEFNTDLTNAGNTCKDALLRWVTEWSSTQSALLYTPKKGKRRPGAN